MNDNRKKSNHIFYGPNYPIAHPGVFPFNLKANRWTMEQWLTFDWRAGWGTKEFEKAVADGQTQVIFPPVWSEADDRFDAREIIKYVPDDAIVSAHYAMTPHLAHRKYIYQFPNPFRIVLYGPDISMENSRLDDRADAVEYLVLQVNKSPEDQADFDAIKDAFTLVHSNASWELWQRNRDVPLPPLQPRSLIAP